MKHGTLAPVAFALATLCVYASTMYPSAAGGDATEFAFIACDFPAVPHPPGYPTFALLTAFASRAFRAMRFGGPAWGSNFASASCGAAASGVLYAAIRDAVGGRREGSTTIATHAAAALGAGLFACGKNTWTNTIQSEVFGLNNLFVAAAVYFTVAFARDNAVGPAPDRSAAAFKHALKGAFTCGLAMSNQHTFALVGTPARDVGFTPRAFRRREVASVAVAAARRALGPVPRPDAVRVPRPRVWDATGVAEWA